LFDLILHGRGLAGQLVLAIENPVHLVEHPLAVRCAPSIAHIFDICGDLVLLLPHLADLVESIFHVTLQASRPILVELIASALDIAQCRNPFGDGILVVAGCRSSHGVGGLFEPTSSFGELGI